MFYLAGLGQPRLLGVDQAGLEIGRPNRQIGGRLDSDMKITGFDEAQDFGQQHRLGSLPIVLTNGHAGRNARLLRPTVLVRKKNSSD